MKPLLLLDVDGVINRFGIAAHTDDAYVFIADGFRVTVPNTARAHIAQLQEHFEMHWATAWEDRAHRAFAAALGLDPEQEWPHIKFNQRPVWRIDGATGLGLSWKLPSLSQYVGDRPFVWIDDDVPHDAREFVAARNLRIPSKVVITKPEVGLDATAMAEALRFADELREGRAA